MEYNLLEPEKTLDEWQKEYIGTKGNCFLLCGRQSGKTTAASIKFAERAVNNPKQVILMLAYTERQAYNLFFMTLMYLRRKYPKKIKKGKDKPTKHIINLTNGSQILCYAAGLSGEGIRTYTVTSLVIDEAAPMAREVFIAVTPMLSVTGGSLDVLSTPRGKQGYFYECSKREDFTKFYVSAEDCPRHSKAFLDAEKERMSSLEYAQEYLAQFLDDLKRLFSDELIRKCCILKRPEHIDRQALHFMGCDIARLGRDESTFEVFKKLDDRITYHVESIVTRKQLTTQTEAKIIELAGKYPFERESIGIDAGAGSLGVGVFDHLLNEEVTKRKVVAINNRARSLDRDDKAKTKLLKEDLYNNLVGMMERGEIQLLDDDEIMRSLASIQYEYIIKGGHPTKLRIFGNYSHITEGIIRAAWLAKAKHLNMWIKYIKA